MPANKKFEYEVMFYDEEQKAQPATKRTLSRVTVEGTSVSRAVTAAKKELGIEYASQWIPVAVVPRLTSDEAARYKIFI